METIKEIEEKILAILDSSTCEYHIPNFETNLFCSSTGLMPRDLLYVFIELERLYPSLNFNQIVSNIQVFSIYTISKEILKQLT